GGGGGERGGGPADGRGGGTARGWAGAGRRDAAGAAPGRPRVHRRTPRRRPEPGAAGRGRPPEPLPFRPAVQGGQRAAAAPVRHPAPRRAGQATAASRNGPVPGGRRRARPLLGSKPILPSLQAPRRRRAGGVPDARKNRLKNSFKNAGRLCQSQRTKQIRAFLKESLITRKSLQETGRRPPLPFLMSRGNKTIA